MENNKILIDFKDASINQQEQTVLKNVNLQIKEKDFVDLLGKVGSGKSTFLKSLYCEVPIVSGEAKILDWTFLAFGYTFL